MSTILIIEDETNVRATIAEILSLKGFTVRTAASGREGILSALAQPPDLILCDVMMPEMDGFEVLATIRGHNTLSATPFLFLTARVERTSIRQGMELGADDYITKPFSSTELLSAISVRLERVRQQREDIRHRLHDLQHTFDRTEIHELNTPLNGILGGADLLHDSWPSLTDDERLEIVDLMRISAHRLHRTLSNYFYYKQITGSSYPVVTGGRTENAGHIIRSAALTAAQRHSRERDVQFSLIPLPAIGVNSDTLLKMVDELVDNACKFSPQGSMIIITSVVLDHRAIVEIADSGRGMTEHQQQEIAAYTQFDRGLYEQQGSGLGFTIARTLAERSGGTVTTRSRPGGGLVVVLSLPALE